MSENSSTREQIIEFTCNICGRENALPLEDFDREAGHCRGCNSTVRHRSIAYLVTKYLLGKPQILRSIPRMGLRGAGLSCSEVYATYLKRKFRYTNTFFDREPFLDINNPSGYEDLDFLIASDVFEHTMPPAIRAFEGASRILKDRGLLVLTVPFALNEQMIEHYPECTGYRKLELENGEAGVELRLRDGSTRVDEKPFWHDGIGKTLEMRVFSRNGMLQFLAEASFEVLEEFAYSVPQFGIVTMTGENWGLPVAARRVRRGTHQGQDGRLQPKSESGADEASVPVEASRTRPAALEVWPLEGWYDVESDGFRWTAKQFSLEVTLPGPAREFAFPFFLPEAVYHSGPVKISCTIDGQKAGSITCASPGALELQGRFPVEAVFHELDFTVESQFEVPGDDRDLGVCVSVPGGAEESAEQIPFRVW